MVELRQTEAFRQWRRRLRDERAKAMIAARLNRLAHGLAGDAQPVGEGVSELRIHHGPGYRVYFKQHGQTIVILLCGGTKSSQGADIAKARQLARNLEPAA